MFNRGTFNVFFLQYDRSARSSTKIIPFPVQTRCFLYGTLIYMISESVDIRVRFYCLSLGIHALSAEQSHCRLSVTDYSARARPEGPIFRAVILFWLHLKYIDRTPPFFFFLPPPPTCHRAVSHPCMILTGTRAGVVSWFRITTDAFGPFFEKKNIRDASVAIKQTSNKNRPEWA